MNKVVKIGAHEVGHVDRALEQLYQRPGGADIEASRSPGPARIAVYGSLSGAPAVEELGADSPVELIGLLATRVYEVSQAQGGRVPFSAIKEVVENLVHADFKDVVISVLTDGNTIKVSDHGPGIADKTLALQPGHTSAAGAARTVIKGVGSGLTVASAALTAAGGSLELKDNMGGGTVVTLTVPDGPPRAKEKAAAPGALPRLSKRQKKVLFLALEMGQIGPSRVATELSAGLSTAYRDLQALENLGLIKCDKQGKRSLTDFGVDSLDTIMSG